MTDTGTDLAVREPAELATLSNEQLNYIARTEFVPPGLRGNLPAILACVATGRALGLPDMVALRSIHVIDGKATFSAELMVSLARRAGHSITGEVTEGRARVKGRRKDNGDEMTVEWTLGMAERAGLTGKGNWKKYPEAMLWARAVSQLCRELFADCFAGATYTPEEIGASETDEQGVPLEEDRDVLEGTPMSDGWEDKPADFNPSTPVKVATDAQKKKLNVLVGKLRDDEDPDARVTTERLWRAVAKRRNLDWSWLVEAKRGMYDGRLHWSPLREDLTHEEASALIKSLSDVEKGLPPFEPGEAA